MRFGVVIFPGTWSDRDMLLALGRLEGAEAVPLWHKERDLQGVECVILPGGFSYGDYLRTGAIARFSPVMESVVEFAGKGGLVLGSCNGFQVLCEAGLLPGALVRNASLEFRCQWQHIVCERGDTPFTRGIRTGEVLRIPISHGEGNYVADPAALSRLEQNGQVVFRYCDAQGVVDAEANPNGSQHNIAGIVNERGNVLGLMPHPERCADADLGGDDGARLFAAMLEKRAAAGVA